MFVPPWPSRSHLTPITLNRLERPQVEALITHLAGGKALPAEVVAHIVAKTDGVPLFVEELTKMLLESDLLQEDTQHYVLTGPLTAVTIPATLQDSLMARLDRLGAGQGRGPTGGGGGARVCLRRAPGHGAPGRGDLAGAAGAVGRGRTALPAGSATAAPAMCSSTP